MSRATGSFLSVNRADLSGARLTSFKACYDQNFRAAILRGADLSGAELCGSFWHGADLAGADLSGSNVTHAVGLTQRQLDQACGDVTTQLPSLLTISRCLAGRSE